MTDPGLSNRLQQHARRAGLNVGVTMALAIAICILGFATIYAQMAPLLSDFVGLDSRSDPVSAPNDDEGGAVAAAPTQPTPTSLPAGQAPAAPTAAIASAAPTQPSGVFAPTHQITSTQSINFRAEPSASGGDATIITTLPPATALQFLGEDAPTEDPAADGDIWMRFRIESGQEGWIREIDVEAYQP